MARDVARRLNLCAAGTGVRAEGSNVFGQRIVLFDQPVPGAKPMARWMVHRS